MALICCILLMARFFSDDVKSEISVICEVGLHFLEAHNPSVELIGRNYGTIIVICQV